MDRVGIYGYGRFGRALGELLIEAEVVVQAYDPFSEPPEHLRVDSPSALAAGVSFVVLAVPVTEIEKAATLLRPHLRPEQLVLDVGSVKLNPLRAMEAVFGAQIPFVGTHPLFGPSSLARGERPLRVVVCPNIRHPSAADRAQQLFERIGCFVMRQDPEAHDRVMAETHALAFFIAKGMLDAGVPYAAPLGPPSFQAIARTIEAVRSDAGHLFSAIEGENPFAADARARLLDALVAVHEALGRKAAVSPQEVQNDLPPADPVSFLIPDLGSQSPELLEARDLIDEVDHELCVLLARRAQLARRAKRAKRGLGHGVVSDPARETALLAVRRGWAEALSLDADAVEELFRAILRFSRRVQVEPSHS